jgi:hypothetical protein
MIKAYVHQMKSKAAGSTLLGIEYSQGIKAWEAVVSAVWWQVAQVIKSNMG